ncbi:MAG: DUF1326 domain-containing protein, partial [Vicinamibacterales bacterium]
MGYQLDGRILEVCDCGVLCPCWIGEDPDNGTCDAIVSYRIDQGAIAGVDVSGRTVTVLNHIPGNILAGNHKVLLIIDDGASDQQQQALTDAFAGKHGGPLGDLAQLTGELVGVEKRRTTFEVEGAKGFLKIEGLTEAELQPYTGPTGAVTALHESVFSTIPGSPAYVGKATSYTRTTRQYGLPDVDL